MGFESKKIQQGIAALPVLLVLTGLLIMTGVLIGSVSFGDNLASDNLSDSEKALSLAQAGARDGLERIVRNKNYSGSYDIAAVTGGCGAPFSGCSSVSVDSGTDPKVIDSSGRVGEFIRKIKVNAYLDSNGLITRYDWLEN